MPTTAVPPDVQEFLRQPNPCVVASLDLHGELHTAATWYAWLGDGTVLLNMDESRRRLEHLRRDPRVALTVLDEGNWYRHVSIVGRVLEIRVDAGLEDIDRLARHYTGQPYGNRERVRWSAIVGVNRWHSWDSR
ncbi:MAG TPA: TIGR03618 family F420-dependent PPOX class oxidoreductase [Candidatus Dormibacteraeota bacterium]|jgi:PPOX class probable F420-dependent enzyme|nr:TIGR03618 family F420-dependent PPOX class oxidoreductase [Candidatus Dormibacteraeota bacterium]